MSIVSRSRQASMAAEPVSPEVAPTMVICPERRFSSVSKNLPSSCRAMSLNAKVGPQKSSMSQMLSAGSPSGTSGATSGWLKLE